MVESNTQESVSPSEYQDLVAFLGERFTVIDRQFAAVDRRFDTLTAELHEFRQEWNGFRREALDHFDALYGRLERLEQEYHAITQGLRRIEGAMADDRRRREIVERDLAELKQRVATLESRIIELEQRLQS
jgi:chromosome segregation ATPase